MANNPCEETVLTQWQQQRPDGWTSGFYSLGLGLDREFQNKPLNATHKHPKLYNP